jgi:ribosome-associated protein
VSAERRADVDSEALARRIAAIADGKKAVDIVALDMRGLVAYTDFLVICTAGNERQAKAVHDDVYAQLKADGLLPDHVEGVREASWVLMDYLDCVLHVFVPAERDYYRLENLWGEAPRLDLNQVRQNAPLPLARDSKHR